MLSELSTNNDDSSYTSDMKITNDDFVIFQDDQQQSKFWYLLTKRVLTL